MARKTLKKLALIVAASALCAGVFSCQKDADEKGGFTTGGDGSITFGVAFGNPSQDLTVKGSFELKDDAGNAIAMIEEATIDTPSPEQTKATLINGEGDFDSFKVTGYSGTSVYDGIKGLTVEKKTAAYPDGHAKWLLGSEKKWPANTDLEFFAWAPAAAWTTAPTLHPGVNSSNVEFSYTVTDALSQKDIMLAHYKGNGKDNTLGASSAPVAGVATMNFTHALSSLTFQCDLTDPKLKDITINSIKLDKIVKKANCTVSFDEASPYDWTPATPADITSYEKSFGEEGITPEDFNSLDSDMTFIVIPQTFEIGSEASIILTLTREGEPVTVSYKLADETRSKATQETTWDAGKTTKYIITINADLDIEIRETFEDNIKSDVCVENTGRKASYVRMSIVANWVDGKGNIIRSCDWMTTGTLEGQAWGNAEDKWILGEDGWFYYKYVLKPGPEIYSDCLFTKYDPGLPQFPGTKLMMEVMAQGVEYDETKTRVTAAWGSAAAAHLTTEFDE